MKTIRALLGCASAVAATAVFAQAITFFEYDNFGGRRFGENNAIANFEQYGFNDRAASAIINYGQWQLCTDAYFRGRCVTLNPGQYPDLRSMGIGTNVSSARQVAVGPQAAPSPAPIPGPGGGQVVFYDRYDFGGSSFPINGAFDDLDRTRWNDRALSMVVHSGTWELCNDSHFQGGCERFSPGQYPNLGGLAGRVSSLRQIGGGSVPAGGGTWYPDNWGGHSRVVLYESPNLSGRRYVIENEYVPNFDATGFNDRASSLRVERGYWMFCSDAQFRGTCRTFGPGDYPSLPSGLNNQISSGRRVSDDYPYKGNPTWGAQGAPR